MARFKINDRVRVIKEYDGKVKIGAKGKVIEIDCGDGLDVGVQFDKAMNGHTCHGGKDKHCYYVSQKILVKNGKGRPTKEDTIQYVVQYDLTCGDPVKTFYNTKELKVWLKEAQTQEDLVFDSIKVYEVKKQYEVKTSFSLRSV